MGIYQHDLPKTSQFITHVADKSFPLTNTATFPSVWCGIQSQDHIG